MRSDGESDTVTDTNAVPMGSDSYLTTTADGRRVRVRKVARSPEEGDSVVKTTADGRKVRYRKVSREEALRQMGNQQTEIVEMPDGRKIIKRVVSKQGQQRSYSTDDLNELRESLQDSGESEAETRSMDSPQTGSSANRSARKPVDFIHRQEQEVDSFDEEVVDDEADNLVQNATTEDDGNQASSPSKTADIIKRFSVAKNTEPLSFVPKSPKAPKSPRAPMFNSRRSSMSAMPPSKAGIFAPPLGGGDNEQGDSCLLVNRTYYSKPVFVARFRLPVVLIQSWVRGCLQRKKYHKIRDDNATVIQSRLRVWLTRRKFKRILNYVRNGGEWDNTLTCWSISCSTSVKTIPDSFIKKNKMRHRRQTMIW